MTLQRLSLALAACALLAGPLHAETQPVRILASLPITYGLGASLLDGSAVQLQRAAPANLPASRQPSYFAGRGAGALDKAARDADAVIGLRSLWPDDPLYPLARRSNIRIVEVDGARPVDGALPGIALRSDGGDALASQPWLNINNLGRMADVIAADLNRLAPEAKPQIEANLATLKQRLLKLSAASESRLAELDNLSVASLSDHFDYLIDGLNLDLVELSVAKDAEWTTETLAQLSAELRGNDVAAVLVQRQPPADLAKAISDGGSRLVLIEDNQQEPVARLETAISQVLDALSP
ncbi:metal ABC transporter substrate-binding protein [Pseudomonas sp. LMG 31766]|jgi:ABC-type Zn uptake system ZnuABC Zn-binding protein ZnuA|uniref:Zinc ABC transporter substrate-binding protein n=1 Tax=Pseudomonas chaetocerotis TaxID=2758695 RepID=A0A931D1U1_9PSED|nr:zinc ABC transporter substrate-binding protein [Pseudomonas chaetocerotis]MBZ9666679.1 metal ABC transporter substrate-binding protein [Pseudomonas chaetocerotis]